MIQVIAIALQLSGALILLMWSIRDARKTAIIERCFPGSNFAERDEDNNCIIEKGKLQKVAYAVYLNIAAFLDLIVGYPIAYFANSYYSPISAMLYTILATAFIIGVEMLLARGVAKLRYKKDELVAYVDLEKAGVDTLPTAKEIDDMFK